LTRVSFSFQPAKSGRQKTPFEQHGELRRRHGNRAAKLRRAPPEKVSAVDAFVPQLRMQTLRLYFRSLCGSRKRLLLQVDDGTVWSVPPQWTDLAGLDPAVVMGDGRAFLRAVDLMELASLVKRLSPAT
jgi:uncharacterized protein DUF5372